MGVDDTAWFRRHLVSGLVTALVFVARTVPGVRTVQGLAVLGLSFYGAWLIYQPAGYLTAAGLLLLDLATDRST